MFIKAVNINFTKQVKMLIFMPEKLYLRSCCKEETVFTISKKSYRAASF